MTRFVVPEIAALLPTISHPVIPLPFADMTSGHPIMFVSGPVPVTRTPNVPRGWRHDHFWARRWRRKPDVNEDRNVSDNPRTNSAGFRSCIRHIREHEFPLCFPIQHLEHLSESSTV